jgi:pectate lyase
MHQNTNLVGYSDNETTGFLSITFSFNWWGEGCKARMPMARAAKVHVLNNYYTCTKSVNCINPRKNSEFLIEGNYFGRGVRNYYSQKDATSVAWRSNNFIAESNSLPHSIGTPVEMPYSYTVAPCSEVSEVVRQHAGATLKYHSEK